MYLVPVLMNFLIIIIFAIFIREDSIMHNLSIGNDKSAKILISKIYDKSEDSQLILDQLKSQILVPKSRSKKSSLWRSLFGRKYRRGTLVASAVALLLQFAGINVFNMYSNRLVTIINQKIEKDGQVSANVATQIVGVCSIVSALGAVYTVQNFGRRTLYLWGQGLTAIFLALFAVAIHLNSGHFAMGCLISFLFATGLTTDALLWTYVGEILSDT